MSNDSIAQKQLENAKQTVALFALDYDGTLVEKGDTYTIATAKDLIALILNTQKNLVIISARAATGLKLIKPVLEACLASIAKPPRVFFAGGNGTFLREISKSGSVEIYKHALEKNVIDAIVKTCAAVYAEHGFGIDVLNPDGVATFTEFLSQGWDGIIPSEILETVRPYAPTMFAEESKVSIVLPKDHSGHQHLVEELRTRCAADPLLKSTPLAISMGDPVHVHITRELEKTDPKLYALNKVQELLNLKDTQIVAIGDMPGGNDNGLLVTSGLPYSFTNDAAYTTNKANPESPPYLLPDLREKSHQPANPPQNRVKMVYDAVRFLCSVR
jgi:hydroxymethylpyrimidine pyrophosphatase-like HAD family hydrolase